jgi:hypothetical protein
MKKLILATAFAVSGVVVLPSAAFAGEITGNGKATGMAGNAKSACGYSGQEDNPVSPLRTQTPHEVYFDLDPDPANWGVINPPAGSPAQPGSCNPTRP